MEKSFIYLFACLLMCTLWLSCGKTQVSPVKKSNKIGVTDTANQGNIIPSPNIDSADMLGTWKWSAQYDLGNPLGDVLTPANTGIQETLTIDAGHNWTQTQNGIAVNSGKYRFGVMMPPSGWPVAFLTLSNKSDPNAQTYDTLDFTKGFSGSFAVSKDSLVFYGVYGQSNTVTQRVYTR
jgi:hypothetical protein